MILVAMGNYKPPYLINILCYISEIGNNRINTEQLRARKCKPAINDKHIIAVFINRHILADFIHTAEKCNLNALLLLFSVFACLCFFGSRCALGLFSDLTVSVIALCGIPFSRSALIGGHILFCHKYLLYFIIFSDLNS